MKTKQKQNYKSRITLLLTLLFFLVGTLFYRQAFLSLFAILLLIIPVILIYLTYYFYIRMKVTFKLKTASITDGNNIIIQINVDNPTIFPFLNCEIDFTATNIYYNMSKENTLSILAHAKKTSPTTITFQTKGAGMCEVLFSNIRVTDPLHLYTFYKSDKQIFKIPVIPENIARSFPLFPNTFTENDEDELSITGLQPNQDIKEIREYRPGDKLQNIHWKLSAKKDEIMVKEFQSNASRILIIVTELEKEHLQDTLKTTWSYMQYLVSQRELFKVFIYNNNSHQETSKFIYNMDDAYEALLSLYYLPCTDSDDSYTSKHHDIYGDETKVIRILGNEIIQI